MSSGFVAGKAVASITGPAGVALVGQFTNFIAIILTLSNGAINNGIVKYTAENDSKGINQSLLFTTALKISIFCSVVVGITLFLFAGPISNWIFKTPDEYTILVRIFSFCILLYSLNSLLISILNGLRQIKMYTLVNTMGSVVSLLLTLLLVFYFKLTGALYALILSQSIACIITCILLSKVSWFKWNAFKGKLDNSIAKNLLSFSVMALVSVLAMPLAQIIIRNHIASNLGFNSAGYWQAIMRVSDAYLMLFTTAFSTYYLPKLSSLHTDRELRIEIINGYKFVVPILLSSVIIIFFARHLIIKILFTSEFTQMENLFFFQLLGDLFKMLAWILSYLMLAKSMTKEYIITEIFFGVSYVFMCIILTNSLGLKGIVVAFAINYFMYMLCMLFLFRRLLFFKNQPSL